MSMILSKKFTAILTAFAKASITADASGNVYAAGWFTQTPIVYGAFSLNNNGTGSTHDCLIVKYDPSGNVLWAKKAGGINRDLARSVAVDASGNAYVAD